MAKSRRSSRRANRSRKNRRGVFGYVYNPINQALGAIGNVSQTVTGTVGKVVGNTVSGVRKMGKNVSGRGNAVISGLLMSKKSRKGSRKGSRKNRKSRKSRR
jgi:hypothetical protein